jgi:hypothetical protein
MRVLPWPGDPYELYEVTEDGHVISWRMQGGGKGARAKVPRELRYDRDRLDKYWFVVM